MNILNCFLLVDNDETTYFVNQILLEDLKLAKYVRIATNGSEALQLITRQ